MEVFVIIMIVLSPVLYKIYSINANKAAHKEEQGITKDYIKGYGYNADVQYDYNDASCGSRVIIAVDNARKVLIITNANQQPRIVKFTDIIGCNVQMNGVSIGGVGSAISGGTITGTSVDSFFSNKGIKKVFIISLIVSDIVAPEIKMVLMNYPGGGDSVKAQYVEANIFAQRIVATIKAIINENERSYLSNLDSRSVITMIVA